MAEHMLSTIDNPFNPFTQYEEWRTWDETAGYNCNAFLGRIAITSNDMSEADISQAMEDAIAEICAENVNGMYIRVPQPSQSAEVSSNESEG